MVQYKCQNLIEAISVDVMMLTNRIKELRKKAGLSQERLGEHIGCNKSKVSKLENGNQELTQNWMLKIASALQNHGLKITASDLLPSEQRHLCDYERRHLEAFRTLQDSQKKKFHAMISDLQSDS